MASCTMREPAPPTQIPATDVTAANPPIPRAGFALLGSRLLPCDARHVRCDVVDLLRLQLRLEGRHPSAAVLDLVLDRIERGLQLVEVRPDRARRARVLERVAALAARRGEHGLACCGVPLTAR